MKVELLHSTPLEVVIKAIRKCYASEGNSDSNWGQDAVTGEKSWWLGTKDCELIRRILSHGHGSVVESAYFTFDVDGISRGCLQELVRHRVASFSVKSTRYTLGKIKDEQPFDPDNEEDWDRAAKYLVYSTYDRVNTASIIALEAVRNGAATGVPNDQLKYCLPESFKTSLIWTINARSLQNFFQLRSAPQAQAIMFG